MTIPCCIRRPLSICWKLPGRWSTWPSSAAPRAVQVRLNGLMAACPEGSPLFGRNIAGVRLMPREHSVGAASCGGPHRHSGRILSARPGDYDYSRTAHSCGIPLRVAPSFLGTCAWHDKAVPWTDREVPLIRRLRNLYSPLGNAQPRYYFHYVRKHEGFAGACRAMVCMHVRVFSPPYGQKRNRLDFPDR